jgi:hypothetical protein
MTARPPQAGIPSKPSQLIVACRRISIVIGSIIPSSKAWCDRRARVASKWSSEGHAADAAEDWALHLVEDYAKARGIALVRHDNAPRQQPENAPPFTTRSPPCAAASNQPKEPEDLHHHRISHPGYQPQRGDAMIKTYRAEYFTAADYAVRSFEADTPEHALELARRFYDEDCGALDFRSYDGTAGVDQIQIWDNKRGALALWESDEFRLRRAAPELLAALSRLLPRYADFLTSAGADLKTCEDYQAAKAALAKANPGIAQ